MVNYFTFAGKSSQDFKVYISGQGTYNAPARVYSSYEIPGRNGALLVDEKRFENCDVSYPAFIYENMQQNLEAFRNYILSKKGYQRLEDTYHPEEFRLAAYYDGLDAAINQRHDFTSFEVTFHCKPQRFLKSGERVLTLTSSGSIENPTEFESKPLLRVYGTGTLGIGSQSITISQADTYTDIDCEMMDCFKGATGKNDKVTFTDYNFPTLKPGTNNFSLGSGITKVEITPRWWIL